MGNSNAGCCSQEQQIQRGNLRYEAEESCKSRPRRLYNVVSPTDQQRRLWKDATPSRYSLDIPSHKGSNYVDPLSFTSSDSLVGESRVGNSNFELWYLTSTSPAEARAHNISGGRRTTHSQVWSRETNFDNDRRRRGTKTKGRSWDDEAERQVCPSHKSQARDKVYRRRAPKARPVRSGSVAPGREKVHSGSRRQKRNSDIRGSFASQSRSSHSHTETMHESRHEASRSREDSFVPPSHGRERRNAVRVETYEMPRGVCKGDRRYIQFGNDIWETVYIEGWNHWNGTWQVSDTNGHSMQAAPLALKTEEEYRFLSKEREIRYRSFGSFGSVVSRAD